MGHSCYEIEPFLPGRSAQVVQRGIALQKLGQHTVIRPIGIQALAHRQGGDGAFCIQSGTLRGGGQQLVLRQILPGSIILRRGIQNDQVRRFGLKAVLQRHILRLGIQLQRANSSAGVQQAVHRQALGCRGGHGLAGCCGFAGSSRPLARAARQQAAAQNQC